MSRLFLALWPNARIQQKMIKWREACTWPSDAAIVAQQSLHLTLHFLGEVPDARVPELIAGLNVPFKPFDIHFGDLRVWPHGIVVVTLQRIPTGLEHLHTTLSAALNRLDIAIEARRFRPHITLARHADGVAFSEHIHHLSWHVNSFALVQSSSDGTSQYRIVKSYHSS
jgi:2'-5' RNA ligase